MNRVLLIIASLMMLAPVVCVGLSCSEDDEAEVTWKLATFTMEGEITTDILQDFADQVNERSDGRMEIKIFTGGTLYQGADIFDAVSSGNIELGECAATWFYEKMPKYTSVIVQPWGNDIEERAFMQKTVIEEFDPIANESLDNSIMTCMLISIGEMDFMFDRPVTVKEDVAGLHLWSGGGVANPIIEYFGATPVELDFTEIQLSAQSGTIDGCAFMSVDMYYKQKLYEMFPYMVLMPHAIEYCSPLLMNSDSFEDLPEDLQQIVLDAALDAEEDGFKVVNLQYEDQVDALEADTDVDVYTLPVDERARWLDEIIVPVCSGSLSMVFSEDEIAQITAIATAAQAEIASGS